MLHVLHFGLEEVKDLVLEACLHNQVYDQDLESVRGDWLFSMFRDTPHLPEFRSAILKALETETNYRNFLQLCHLAWEFTDLGDDEAHRLFGENVYRVASDPNMDVSPADDWWIELEGTKGFVELARIYGQRLLVDPKRIVNDLYSHFEDHPEYRAVLKEYSQKDATIHAYCEYLVREEEKRALDKLLPEERRMKNHTQVREKYTLQKILNDAHNNIGKIPGRYFTFGKHALPEELEQVYAALMNESQDPVRTRLLSVFRRARLPRLDEVLFEWAVSDDDELKAASIAALAQVSDERVHRLARSKLETTSMLGADHEVLDLLLRNYQPEDAALITKSLASLHAIQEYDSHELGFDLIELANKYQDPGLADGVGWVYENTPCGFCRYKAVEWLSKFGLFTEGMRYECQHDADADMREFAGEKGINENA